MYLILGSLLDADGSPIRPSFPQLHAGNIQDACRLIERQDIGLPHYGTDYNPERRVIPAGLTDTRGFPAVFLGRIPTMRYHEPCFGCS